MLNFAFLGCGHIAKSLIQGFQKNTDIKIFGYDILEQNKEWLEKNNHSSCSLEQCIKKSDIIFLCVKPQDLKTLCDEIMEFNICLLYTSPSPRDLVISRMPSSA